MELLSHYPGEEIEHKSLLVGVCEARRNVERDEKVAGLLGDLESKKSLAVAAGQLDRIESLLIRVFFPFRAKN